MNKWKCDHPGCDTTAVGMGGAIGLRAIGWWSGPGPHLLCPAHRPDPTPCHQKDNPDYAGKSCTLCTADDEARRHQAVVRAVLEGDVWDKMPPEVQK